MDIATAAKQGCSAALVGHSFGQPACGAGAGQRESAFFPQHFRGPRGVDFSSRFRLDWPDRLGRRSGPDFADAAQSVEGTVWAATISLLLAREVPKLRRYARLLTRDRAQAEDLVQSSLVRALNPAAFVAREHRCARLANSRSCATSASARRGVVSVSGCGRPPGSDQRCCRVPIRKCPIASSRCNARCGSYRPGSGKSYCRLVWVARSKTIPQPPLAFPSAPRAPASRALASVSAR